MCGVTIQFERPMRGLPSAGGSWQSTSTAAADSLPDVQGGGQVSLVHHRAPGGVDENGSILHCCDGFRPDKAAGGVKQGAVKADHVGLSEHLIPSWQRPRRTGRPLSPGGGCRPGPASQRPGPGRATAGADAAVAHHAPWWSPARSTRGGLPVAELVGPGPVRVRRGRSGRGGPPWWHSSSSRAKTYWATAWVA